MVQFKTTKAEAALVKIILDRAERLKLIGSSRLDLEMDITATHANGCPLDFEKWLTFDDFSFTHDIGGIRGHIDRNTGKLTRCFLPRCAKG